MGGFSLLPSVVVFAAVIVALVGGALLLRRRARLRPAPVIAGAPVRVPVEQLVKEASIQLVQMDDAIRAAEDELEFARAEFGEDSVHEFAEALATARRRSSEAFALKQRLDDSSPDTAQEQRDWSRRIMSLSDSALALVTTQSRAFDERRRLETAAPESIRRVRDRIRLARERIPDADDVLRELRARFAPEAFAAIARNTSQAAAAFDEADAAAADAAAKLDADPLAPVSRLVQRAEAAVRHGESLLDAVDRMPATLRDAGLARDRALSEARTQLTEAAALRGTLEDPAAVSRIIAAAAALRDTIAASDGPASPTGSPAGDPARDLDELDRASALLDDTLAGARSAQQRLDAARIALAGALTIAESHIGTAETFISARRGHVGADARTRLSEARRELELARQEADPVAALDGARRAASLATHADSLARYDALGGPGARGLGA